MTMSATAPAAAAPTPSSAATARQGGWFARAEAWLDARGRGAWIAAMVLGFIFFWPVGLALLFYILWSNRMSCSARRTGPNLMMTRGGSSGNAAFDQYKADTLRRLEDEQKAFEDFLRRLREAKDKSEFDQFLDERARSSEVSASEEAAPGPDAADDTAPRPAG